MVIVNLVQFGGLLVVVSRQLQPAIVELRIPQPMQMQRRYGDEVSLRFRVRSEPIRKPLVRRRCIVRAELHRYQFKIEENLPAGVADSIGAFPPIHSTPNLSSTSLLAPTLALLC